MEISFELGKFDEPDTPLGGALSSCMEYCIPDCCGFNAFNITAENMTGWADTVTTDLVDQALHDLNVIVERVMSGPERFFQYCHDTYRREETSEWLKKVQIALEQVRPFARQASG